MAYFPLFVELEKQPVWVIGGGQVALRKVKKLLPYGARITVIAPEIVEEINDISEVIKRKECFHISMLERAIRRLDERLEAPTLVIAATDQGDLNAEIARVCKNYRVPVNVVDDLEQCSFVFPALVKEGKLSAGICTSGVSPTASAYFKNSLKETLPDNLDSIFDWLEEKREEIKENIPEQKKRASFYRQLFELCMKHERIPSEEEWMQLLHEKCSVGSVALVGAGCGKADLITVRGLRLLQQCEAVVYDDLIDPELLEYVSETAERIYMGKRSGHHSAPQEEINQTLIKLANRGLKVVRLKGGDPYIFGRGGEEMLALKEAGIPCQEVPGIPSPIGVPAEMGIPVTHRGASRGVHIMTAHTSDTPDGLPEDFDAFAKLHGTLVFVMGMKQLPKITARLLELGKREDTPAAVLSGGNSPNPIDVRGDLSNIAKRAAEAGAVSPVIILIGEVAKLDLR